MTFMFQVVMFLRFYPEITSFLAGLLAEEFLLTLGFMAGQKLVSFWTIIIWGFIGVICIDSIYFAMGKSKIFHNYVWRKIEKSRYKKVITMLDHLTHNNLLLSLFLSKFVYGPRTIVNMHFARRMTYFRYLKYELTAIFMWFILMMPLAWLAGKGLISSFEVVKSIERGIGLAIVFTVLIYLLGKFILSRLMKKKFN